MSESGYITKLQAIVQSMLEDTVTFEVDALKEVGGKSIHAFVSGGPRTLAAINDQYILKLIDYIEREEEYNLSDLDYLADYIQNKYPLRAKVRDFLSKIRESLRG